MKNSNPVHDSNRPPWRIALSPASLALALIFMLAGCDRPKSHAWQGYFEGEWVYISSPLAGRLESLHVQKGSHVVSGSPLFTLEHDSEEASRREAVEKVKQLESKLQDLKKGQRPSELLALEARLAQAKVASELSSRQLERTTKLSTTRAIAEEDFDKARWSHESNLKQIAEIEAQIATAKLGSREDVILAADSELSAARAALSRNDWNVAQKIQSSPTNALVYDTLFRQGEFIPAGTPVIALLPPSHLRVRFFVPEAEFASLKAGDIVGVRINGRSAPIEARINYLSSRPEYTPPVLYNRENRSKLVFMVEAIPVDTTVARDLHPGQPADITLASTPAQP